MNVLISIPNAAIASFQYFSISFIQPYSSASHFSFLYCSPLINYIFEMKKSQKIVEISSFKTDCLESPEEKLMNISSNVSFQSNPQKIIRSRHNHHLVKPDCFALKGWENTRTVVLKNEQSKRRGKGSLSNSAREDSQDVYRRSIYQSLQLKTEKTPSNTNFRLKTSKEKQKKEEIAQRQTGFQQFQERMSKQRYNLLHFYQNQRLKRRLMNDLLDPQQTLQPFTYPIAQFSTPSRPKTTRKQLIKHRYFNS